MLKFHVTKGIYELVKQGKKLTEYRDFTHYWEKRLANIVTKLPYRSAIVKGYSSEEIPIIIKNIGTTNKDSINVVAQMLIKTDWCYSIEYDLVED